MVPGTGRAELSTVGVRGELGSPDAASLLQEGNLPLSSFAVLVRLILSLSRSVLFQYCKEGVIPLHKLRKIIPVSPTQTHMTITNNLFNIYRV